MIKIKCLLFTPTLMVGIVCLFQSKMRHNLFLHVIRVTFVRGTVPPWAHTQLLGIKPSIWPNLSTLFKPNLVTCKVIRPDSRSRCSWGEILVYIINLPWIKGIDVNCPTDEPNPTHDESLGVKNLVSFFQVGPKMVQDDPKPLDDSREVSKPKWSGW